MTEEEIVPNTPIWISFISSTKKGVIVEKRIPGGMVGIGANVLIEGETETRWVHRFQMGLRNPNDIKEYPPHLLSPELL